MSPLTRTAAGFAWNHVARVGEYVLFYLTSILIARYLGPELNGSFAIFLSVVQLLMMVSSLGHETALVSLLPRLSAQGKDIGVVFRSVLGRRILAVLVVAAIVLLGHKMLFSLIKVPAVVSANLFPLLLYFGCRSLLSLYTSYFQVGLETRTLAIASLTIRGLELLAIVLLLNAGFGLSAVLVLISASAFVQLSWLAVASPRSASMKGSGASDVSRLGRRFWLNGMLEFFLGRQADVLLLSYFLVATNAIGYYDVALGFGNLINFGLTTGLYGVAVATFSRLDASKTDLVESYWDVLTSLIVLVVTPAFVFAIFFADALIGVLYSPEYLPGVFLFQIYAAALVLTRVLAGGTASDYLQSVGRTGALLRAGGVSGALNLMLALILIPAYGVLGAALATSGSALVVAALHAFYAKRSFTARLPWKDGFLMVFLSVLCAWACAVIFPRGNVVVLSLAYVLSLFIAAYLVKPVRFVVWKAIGEFHNGLAVLLSPFTRLPAKPDAHTRLTDRQKWAYNWLPRSNVVVDLGSSVSPLLDVLHLKARTIYAVDPYGAALKTLQSTRNVIPVNSPAEKMPLPSGSADVVLLLDVLEHVEDGQTCVAEVMRVLKPGGTLILSVPHKGLFSSLDPQNLKRTLTGDSAVKVQRHYSVSELQHLLGDRMQILRIHFAGLFLYPLTFALNSFLQKHFALDVSRMLKAIGDCDYDVSWGRLSYSLILTAEKTG
jgi:O-antigen/teichoic acid export membrane protein/SAM-dependent methyltransferase